MKKRERGITLIALVITIIILLILAGAAISIGLNQSNIFDKANEAKTSWNARVAEENGINDTLAYIEQYLNAESDSEPGILEGNGTTNDPYVINSIEDLVALSYAVNTGTNLYEGNTVILGRNLDFKDDNSYANANAKYKYTNTGCIPDETSTNTIKELMTNTEGSGFTPIGASGDGFKGTFDGKGKSLTNIYIKGTTYSGLFGIISTDITIREVKLINCDIKGSGLTGGIVASNNANLSITGCTISGNIESQAPTGGIIGYNTGELYITQCSASGNITAQAQAGGIVGGTSGLVDIFNCNNAADVLSYYGPAGGIVGQGKGIIQLCCNTGTVNDAGNYSVAGIAGILGYASGDTKIYICYNTGNIGEETTNLIAGGIIGYGENKKVEIINCCNNGIIQSKSPAGGIVGAYSTSSIINCYNFNNVTSENSPAGGIIGSGTISNNPSIENCYNIGDITTNATSACGGIAGNNATITNCYSTGKVSGTSEYNIGYIIGYGTVNNTNKYKKQSPDIQSNGAIEFESEDEMNQTMDVENFINTMNRYNFTGEENQAEVLIWKIENGYPVFIN